uniref:Uncharacterized protein n=1 Tax=Kalanchoe fedtschenkoi TaxID=63787 RepID=A0A7N0TIR7_KALFE
MVMKFCLVGTDETQLKMQNPKEEGSTMMMMINGSRYGSRNRSSDSDPVARRSCQIDINRVKQAEESLRTIMFLSCWGPN